MNSESGKIFVSRLKGWYPQDPARLKQDVDDFISGDADETICGVCALLLPHAGYAFSGPVAGVAVRQIRGKTFKRVIALGPSHRIGLPHVISVPPVDVYSTPLGPIELDRPFILELLKHEGVCCNAQAHDGEHSVQIELPLLQEAIGDFKLVPIVVGQLNLTSTRKLAAILRKLVDEETLVVVSSDFTHYGQYFDYVPFKDDLANSLKKLDMGAFELICRGDLRAFYNYVDETGATICGRFPIGLLMAMLPEDARWHKMRYDTSGNMEGDFSHSVSYLSAVVSGRWSLPKQALEPRSSAPSVGLSDEDRQGLLQLARMSLHYQLVHGSKAAISDLSFTPSAAMRRTMGAFVTLHQHGELRGCIGEIVPRRPLFEAVMDQAVNAGVGDYRFPPVGLDELDGVVFEISALTAPVEVESYRDIVLGRHGIVFYKGGRSAVFLPQVAVEQKWDRATTLSYLAQKAGLQPDAWKEGGRFEVFEAIVFSEKRISNGIV